MPVELEQEFEREMLQEALARTEPLIKPRDWQIFSAVTLAERSLSAVAVEHQLTPAAVGMVNLRVRRKVKQALVQLGGRVDEEQS